MEHKRCFVQFLHPGGEHHPDQGDIKTWNVGEHKRKFLQQPGLFLDDSTLHNGDIVFWGEWEPESQVIHSIADPVPAGPRYIYAPYFVVPETAGWLQNTDPFVFGEQFKYTVCRQHKQGRPTQLRFLDIGSVLLFGSCWKRSSFVLDTILVVDRFVDYQPMHESGWEDSISADYKTITIDRLHGDQSYRLYFGATYEQPRDTMFSFVPCLPASVGTHGFARPRIELPGIVRDNLFMGYRLNLQDSVEATQQLWWSVVEQVREQGLYLGVKIDFPEDRTPELSKRVDERVNERRARCK